MLTAQNVRTKKGCIRRYNTIIRQCYRDAKGGTQYGIDFPTMAVLWPERYQEIQELRAKYKVLP